MPVQATSGSSPRAVLRALGAALGLAALALHPGSALADIFTYTDENGEIHFTNRPNGDPRFKVYIKGDGGRSPRRKGVVPVAPSDKSLDRFSRYDAWIRQAATLYQIPEELVRAVIKCESDYDPRAVSPVGAQGLMQLMPETALRMQVRDPFDARENIFGGTRYLRVLANLFNGDLDLTIAGYNAGEGAVMRYGGIPPYEETQAYVTRVRTYYARYRTTRDVAVASIEP
ncbi:lytic transglycosylase [Sorangium cellulosum]|uniref:Lytic transglycosylase n=1 Tax=Sorangium cellulosum TaxID=56 RepID=A0A4P2PXT4_SORCE|nr:transglycosylase SLT domain-containing protein [Sorangium cellulosum]AUX21685.1 lytic transglycosylase [Sorangium cellulosum]